MGDTKKERCKRNKKVRRTAKWCHPSHRKGSGLCTRAAPNCEERVTNNSAKSQRQGWKKKRKTARPPWEERTPLKDSRLGCRHNGVLRLCFAYIHTGCVLFTPPSSRLRTCPSTHLLAYFSCIPSAWLEKAERKGLFEFGHVIILFRFACRGAFLRRHSARKEKKPMTLVSRLCLSLVSSPFANGEM